MTIVAEQLKLAGMRVAEDLADDVWKAAWVDAIRVLASRGGDFTAEDVRRAAGPPGDHPNAAGAIFARLARERVITKVGYRNSTRAVLHAHPLAVWRGVRP